MNNFDRTPEPIPVHINVIVRFLHSLGRSNLEIRKLIFVALYKKHWDATVEDGVITPFQKTVEEVLLEYVNRKKIPLYRTLPSPTDVEVWNLFRRIETIDN